MGFFLAKFVRIFLKMGEKFMVNLSNTVEDFPKIYTTLFSHLNLRSCFLHLLKPKDLTAVSLYSVSVLLKPYAYCGLMKD